MLTINIYVKNESSQYIHINKTPFQVISGWVVENNQAGLWLNNDSRWGFRKIFFIILKCSNGSLPYYCFLTFYQVPPWDDTVYETHCLGNTTCRVTPHVSCSSSYINQDTYSWAICTLQCLKGTGLRDSQQPKHKQSCNNSQLNESKLCIIHTYPETCRVFQEKILAQPKHADKRRGLNPFQTQRHETQGYVLFI